MTILFSILIGLVAIALFCVFMDLLTLLYSIAWIIPVVILVVFILRLIFRPDFRTKVGSVILGQKGGRANIPTATVATETELLEQLNVRVLSLEKEVMMLRKALEDLMNEYKIVYYYDLESMMTNTELNMMNIIKDTRFNVNDNVKDIILNRYYEEYNGILNDGMFDIFKYNGSTIKETGFSGNTRLIRPVIKAKLVEKDSLEDSYKPEIFNRKTFKSLVIEQRYEMLFDKDNSEDESRFLDMKSKLTQRNVYYTVQNINKYMIKHTTENIRYVLTETEKEIVDKYNNMLGMVDVKDVDKSFKKGIFDVLDNEYNFNNETRKLMKDLIEFGLSEAYSNRLLKINVLEMSGSMTRVEYLEHIEG